MTTTEAHTTVCTVGIRLQGPMQSWAMTGRGAVRGTHPRPTKSGVIGLIANALGRDYSDPIDDLAELRFGVRVDEPGTIEVDYHTTGSGHYFALPREYAAAPSWWGPKNGDPTDPDWMNYAPPRDISETNTGALTSTKANANITHDHYLAGASFLAAVEGTNSDLLHHIAAALAAPARALYLGRKAYGPASPLLEAVAHISMEKLFATHTVPNHRDAVDIYLEPHPTHRDGHVTHDQPTTFNGPTRRAARLETHHTLTTNHPTPQPQGAAAAPANLPEDRTASETTLFDDVFTEGATP